MLFVEIKIPKDCISKLIPQKSCRERKFLEFMEEYSLTTTYFPHSLLLIQQQPLVTNIIKTSQTKTTGLMIPLMESWNNVFIIQIILSKVLTGIKVMALLQIQSLTTYRRHSAQAQQKEDFLPPEKCFAYVQLDSVFGIQNGCFAFHFNLQNSTSIQTGPSLKTTGVGFPPATVPRLLWNFHRKQKENRTNTNS